MCTSIIFVLLFAVHTLCNPLDTSARRSIQGENAGLHRTLRSLRVPSFVEGKNLLEISKIRTKRSAAEECEKLDLCRLHAHSAHSFIDTFELYFVNKENARLWDHSARSAAACEQRFSGCSERPRHAAAHAAPAAPPAPAAAPRREFREEYEDDYY